MSRRTRRVAVVGAGVGGLSAALRLTLQGKDLQVTVLEKSDRPGGKVRTEHPLDLVVEAGPDSFLSRKPRAVELCRELGLADQLVPLAPSGARSFIYWRGRLHPIPPGMLGVPGEIWPFVCTGLLSTAGKLRAALDLVLPRRADSGEARPLGDVVGRRLGNEVLRHIVEPLVAGIHAGDAWAMDAQATFPELLEMERRDRSLLLGAGRARSRQRASAREQGEAQPLFQTLRLGVGQMVDALVGRLDEGALRCSAEVRALRADGAEYVLRLQDGGEERVDAVVLAPEAHVSADLLQDIAPRAAVELFAVNYASVAVVALVYDPDDFPDQAGSGFVVPRDAGLSVTAVTLVHNKWPHEAGRRRLVRCFLGGAHSDPLVHSDEDLIGLARRDLATVLGARNDPLYAAVFRWPRAMPQYAVGHPARVRAAEEALRTHPRVRLAGAALRGVGLPDVIQSGQMAADAVLEAMHDGQ